MSERRQITVGPIAFAEIEGDAYDAISARLDAAGSSWAALGRQLGTSRQNLQRAMRLQAALKIETLGQVLAGLAAIEKRKPKSLAREIEALGLQLRAGASEADEDALLEAAIVVRSNRKTRKK
jgi:hypothetical protein